MEENGICGYVGVGMSTRGGPEKKEGFLKGEAHGDLEDLEDILKKSFVAEDYILQRLGGYEIGEGN